MVSTTRKSRLSLTEVTKTIKIADEFVVIKELPCIRKSRKAVQLVEAKYYLRYEQWKEQVTKHVQLAITTKRKTGSRLMLDSVNCHSISYDKVHNFKTSFSRLNVKNLSNQSFVPNNVQPSSFATFFCDNWDHNSETLSSASLHHTNGIIIQLSSKTEEPKQSFNVASPEFCPGRTSFKPIMKEDLLYTTSKKENQLNVESVEIKSNKIHQILAKREDFI